MSEHDANAVGLGLKNIPGPTSTQQNSVQTYVFEGAIIEIDTNDSVAAVSVKTAEEKFLEQQAFMGKFYDKSKSDKSKS